MKWYACVNDEGLVHYAEHLRVAMASAIHVAKLQPHLVFDGEPARLYEALGRSDFALHRRASGLCEDIARTPPSPGWDQSVARGALLRFEIPLIEETDRFVLYTDCDVMFTGPIDLSPLRPTYFAAAPGHNPYNWQDMCSGVMLMNVEALRAAHPRLMSVAREHLGEAHFYDQETLNTAFANQWDWLPLEYHWKPYWAANPSSCIVHYHGPKIAQARVLAHEAGDAGFPSLYRTFFDNAPDGYAYYERLFDSFIAPQFDAAAYARLKASAPRRAARPWLRLPFGGGTAQTARVIPKAPPIGSPLARWEIATAENFDETHYLAANPDVAAAIWDGAISSAWRHFVNNGRAEGRIQAIPDDERATAENFDATAYVRRNPDVAFAIAQGRFASAREHFAMVGMRERRRQRSALSRNKSSDSAA